ncbi:MAG: ABC transporter ATP-binding protein [Spirochaetales bacterium]
MTPELEVTGLELDYEGLPVLRDLQFSLGAGEHLAILGPSGCGKSTLLRLLTGLETPSRGRILWRGTDLTGAGSPGARPPGAGSSGHCGRFAFMGQQDLLLPWSRLWENVGLPLLLRGQPRAAVRRQVLEFLVVFGLSGFADHFPHQLSGGMRQRAALARTSLASHSGEGGELLLLDEPFASLDVLSRAQLQEWLDDILAHEKSTLVLVTHSVDEALLLAERVIVLSKSPGRIVLEETVPYAGARFADKAWLPEFLAQKKRVLDVLLGSGAAHVH